MIPFAYERVDTMRAAFEAIGSHPGARYIAGGTNILDLMKDTVENPPLLVDINHVGLSTIEQHEGGVFIGALARMSEVARDPHIVTTYPMVAVALEQSASPQLRNMASIGGNVMQRTRCAYFRDVSQPCNKRSPGTGCGAIGGINRMEAVLGTSEHCIASHPSDFAVALTALDATISVAGPNGQRDVSVHDFFLLPGDRPDREHSIAENEMILGIALPKLSYSANSAYVKARDRLQYEFALASAAVALDLENGTIRDARIALGGVGTVPWRARLAERQLAGKSVSDETFAAAGEAAMQGARGWGQNDFKIELGKRAVIAALREVTA